MREMVKGEDVLDRTKWMREMVKGEDVLDRTKWMREMVKGGGCTGQGKVDERNG